MARWTGFVQDLSIPIEAAIGDYDIREPWQKTVRRTGRRELILDTRAVFGSGEHPSTVLLARALLDAPPKGRAILDFGCGSGILGILSGLAGARNVTFVDNDPICRYATKVNCELNAASFSFEIQETVGAALFDIVVANLPLESISAVADVLTSSLAPDGVMFLGGFVQQDAATASEPFSELKVRAGAVLRCAQGNEWTFVVLDHPRSANQIS